MANTLRNLYETAKKPYKIKLVAGANGMDNIISWVHLIEDVSTTDFLRGNELIITTGLGYEGIEWLENFITELVSRNAKGIIINTGRYIIDIPAEIVAYCDEIRFPVFQMPWEIHLEDVMQTLIHTIFQAENQALTISQALKNVLFSTVEKEEYIKSLVEVGFEERAIYSVVVIETSLVEKSLEKDRMIKQIKMVIGNLLTPHRLSYNLVEYREYVVIVFSDCSQAEMVEMGERLMVQLNRFFPGFMFGMSIGPSVTSLDQLHKSYERSMRAMKPIYKNNAGMSIYENLGMEKLIMEINDEALLKKIVHETLGSLLAYDEAHVSNYLEVLRAYVFSEGSIKAVAQQLFTHRNTINYRMNRIRTILGNHHLEGESRLRYQMAFMILDYMGSKEEWLKRKSSILEETPILA